MPTPKSLRSTPTIDPNDSKAILLRLAKARTSLILEHPFIGTIALNMPMTLDINLRPPTAATNGKRVLFHPEFVASLTDEGVKFLVAHECMHPMLEHHYRRGERQRMRWNKAGDYIINYHLVAENIGKMPQHGLHDPAIYNAGGGTTDGVYHILPEDQEGGDWGYESGNPLDNCEDAPGSPAEQAQAEAEMKVMVAQAAQAAKMMGKLSANMARLVDEVLKPKVDWRSVLWPFLVKCRTDERSFARPNRRFLSQGLYLPTATGEVLGELIFWIDCSGSISQQDISQFAAEITKVKQDLFPTKIHVGYFDSKVCHYECYEQQDELDIKPHGGGGTAFSPCFDYMREHGIEPVACVFLTDLCCSDYGSPPDCPVLWVSTESRYQAPPWGEVTVMV